MKNYLISALLLTNLLAIAPVFAQTDIVPPAGVEAETVTTADLGVPDPGLLPTNPFYFLKELGRATRRIFTFNAVSRAELELRIVNEKAAETKKVEETRPADAEAMTEALKNYQEAQSRLKLRFEMLKETSKNPNVDRLLDELADRTVKHEKLFDELAKKFEGQAEIQSLTKGSKEKAEETAGEAAKKDDPAKFAAKLERALIESKGSELKHVRSIEIIDRLSQKSSEDVKQSLERLRSDFSEKLGKDLKEVLEKDGSQKVEEAIAGLPGDTARRAVLLDEVRAKAEHRVAEALNKVAEVLEKTARKEKDISEKAAEQIRHAEERTRKLEMKLAEAKEAPAAVKNLLRESQENLKEAKAAFEEEKYGEAFGQARSAEVLARNGLRMLEEREEEKPSLENLKENLEELEAKIAKYEELVKARGLTPEKNPDVHKLLANARLHLGFAREALAKGDAAAVKLHIGHIKGFLNDLSRIIEGKVRVETEIRALELRSAKPAPATREQSGRWGTVDSSTSIDTIVSTASKNGFGNVYWQCYDSLEFKDSTSCKTSETWQAEAKKFCDGHCYADKSKCGVNTFNVSTQCKAENSETGLPTLSPAGGPTPIRVQPAEPVYCTQQYEPICAENGKTYSNECTAKVAGVAVKYRGECGRPDEKPLLQSSEPVPVAKPTLVPVPAVIDSFFDVFVAIDDSGQFSPSAVKVKKGGKVTWTNKGARAVWPASAFHPTHLLYPGFDALQSLKPGETYSFIFEKVGSWKYHDHLNSGVTGVVEVVE